MSNAAGGASPLSDVRDPDLRVVNLRTQGEGGGGFVGEASPALSWRLEAGRPTVRQLAYELQVAEDPDFVQGLASSGAIATRSPIAAPWPAAPLASRQARWARVRAWSDRGVSDWSAPLRIESALLRSADWTARPISPFSNLDQEAPRPAPLLRRSFTIDRPVASARLYVTALGVHDSWINGQPVGDALLEPGWTAYQRRLLYAAHDVTHLLAPGENVLAAAVGDGWWRGNLTWLERRAVYGATTALLAQLEVRFADGSELVVATDESWRGGEGAIRAADLYDGCSVDLRAEPEGWRRPGFADAAWEPVRALDLPAGLELRPMPPVRVIERWAAAAEPRGQGLFRVDTGQNLAGFLRLTVRGAAGGEVTVRHAEVLDNDGGLYTAALRNARATDSYVLAAEGEVVLEPSFTFHGFRYADVEVGPGVELLAVEVCAISSDLGRVGRFSCSDERVNRLFENARWSQLGNFLALPTDCPQRDERLGWTGDIQVFAATACTNSDARTFLASWLKDLAIEQRADGCVPSTVPNVIQGHQFEYGGVGWGDAASLIPWVIYQAYGDPAVLAAQFDSMRAWVDWCASRRDATGVWRGDFQLGDWLDPGAPSDKPHLATTEGDYIATAYLSFSARTLARAADVLGRSDLARSYLALAEATAAAAWATWEQHLLTTQAGCAIAIEFQIAPQAERPRVAAALAERVRANDFRIGAGFLGAPLVLPALTAGGETDTAYRLLLNERCPGWLYQVVRGATTMWERWDAVREDGQLHTGEMDTGDDNSMISFNHYAYGSVAAWLYRSVAGIAPSPDAPGYGRMVFAPTPGGGLTHAEATLATPYGEAAIQWRLDAAGELAVALEVPAGAEAVFHRPAGWSWPADAAQADAKALELGSGTHRLRLAPAG